MLSGVPTRRRFIQTILAAFGSLILPRSLRATENCSSSWYLHARTGESWDAGDPASWSLENARQPILERARDGLLNLTPADKDRIIRLVTRRCSLNLIEILPGRAAVHHWGQQGRGDLRPFFKKHGLARKDVEVVVLDRKREIGTVQSGDPFLFGERLSQDRHREIYLNKWRRRNKREPDDWSASPLSWSGYAWDGVESNRIPWAALKSAWRRTTATPCMNCDRPTLLTNFGSPSVGLFQRKHLLVHVCFSVEGRSRIIQSM
jgi:hypothetical protein